MSAERAVHVTISGRVQGVGYRAWTVATARGMGLNGWVRNRRDGTVEAVFTGPADQIETMIAACRKGPLVARVTDVSVRDYKTGESFTSFHSQPTV